MNQVVAAGPEEWARRIVSLALVVTVEHHDDGSEASMYDLRVGSAASPSLAVEVVGAVDPLWTETWNVGPGRKVLRPPSVRGEWSISIVPGTNTSGWSGSCRPYSPNSRCSALR
jgi:hypothetical protein